jgi:choline dehydrogenase
MSGTDTTHDYIIVGAGSAGCAVAHRLSEDEDTSVLLLEAGKPDDKEEIHTPALTGELFKTELDWDYSTVPQSGMHDREMYHPRGKMLGGSSSINAMIYMRGVPRDYDRWAKQGNEGWGHDDLLPYFKKAEHFEPGDGESEYHGQGGPLNVAGPYDPHPLSEAMIEAAVETGIPRNEDFNGEKQEGAGYFHVTMEDGQRCSAAKAYITPVLERDNFSVETEAHVTQIRFDSDQAVGVTYEQDGTEYDADADAEVIVSGGAFNSPQLLMLSGIGPADHLQEHGIDVVADLPGVGRNLHDHLTQFVVYDRTKGGNPPLTSNGAEVGAFTYVDESEPTPDLQFHCVQGYAFNHGLSAPEEGVGLSIGPTQLRPESQGHVELASDDPFDEPVIDPQYLSEQADVDLLVEGVRKAREIAQAGALAEWCGEELQPGPEAQTDEELADHIREEAHTIYHPVGTCKMGDDDMAVVDDRLRVHGVSGLRVVDASIMPTIPSGNTNAPTIAVAEKAADLITE